MPKRMSLQLIKALNFLMALHYQLGYVSDLTCLQYFSRLVDFSCSGLGLSVVK